MHSLICESLYFVVAVLPCAAENLIWMFRFLTVETIY